MDPQEEAVNQSVPVSDEQVAQQPEGQQEQVATVEDGQQSEVPVQGKAPEYEAVDETGVPYKNRYMEVQRKLADLTDNLPKIIEDTIVKKQAPQEQEYTIEQLEQIALENPNLRPRVEAEKARLLEQRINKQFEERDKRAEAQRNFELVRMRTEQEIMNDPALKDCFTTNALGQKQWNVGHPLTGIIADIMRAPEVANRPDGLRVASDIAFGRYMREQLANNGKKTQTLQATIKREQKKTLVEGGVPTGSITGDSFSKAKAQLAKTGSKQDAQMAIKEYMKVAGLGRREG